MKELVMETSIEQISASEIWYMEEDVLKSCIIRGDCEKAESTYCRLRDAVHQRFSAYMDQMLLGLTTATIVGGIVHFACKEANLPPAYLSLVIQHQYNLSLQQQQPNDPKAVDEIIMNLLRYATDLIRQFNNPQYSYNVEKAISYIRNNLSEKISLSIVANVLHVSPQYLSALFHQELGITFSDYVLQQKIDLACEYLREENLTITQIAQLCGFEDPNYFSRVFKKYRGTSPRDYRSLHFNP